jgi:hypothetical protein
MIEDIQTHELEEAERLIKEATHRLTTEWRTIAPPKLTAEGVNFHNLKRPPVDPKPVDPRQVAVCVRWLAALGTPIKQIDYHRTSYGRKHDVQRWADEYISNGAFIAAALGMGYKARTMECSPNMHFNITRKV